MINNLTPAEDGEKEFEEMGTEATGFGARQGVETFLVKNGYILDPTVYVLFTNALWAEVEDPKNYSLSTSLLEPVQQEIAAAAQTIKDLWDSGNKKEAKSLVALTAKSAVLTFLHTNSAEIKALWKACEERKESLDKS